MDNGWQARYFDSIDKKLDNLDRQLINLTSEVVGLKVKASVWGAIAAFVVSACFSLIVKLLG